jgi:hypothetical protein
MFGSAPGLIDIFDPQKKAPMPGLGKVVRAQGRIGMA